jgi:hypothetical protein
MGIGQCLDRTFAILRYGFGPMARAAAFVVVPMAVFSAIAMWASYLMSPQFTSGGGWGALRNVLDMLERGPTAMGPAGGMRLETGSYLATVGAGLLVYVVMLFTYPVLWGVVTVLAAQAHLGRPLDPRTAWRTMRGNYWHLVGALLVYGAMVFLSMCFCYIPALFLMPLLLFLVPVVVFEGRGPFQAISRSTRLATPDYGRVLGWVILSWLVVWGASAGLGIALSMGVDALVSKVAGPNSLVGTLLSVTAQQLAGILYLSVLPIFRTLAYFDARSRLESFDLRVRVGEPSPEAPA